MVVFTLYTEIKVYVESLRLSIRVDIEVGESIVGSAVRSYMVAL